MAPKALKHNFKSRENRFQQEGIFLADTRIDMLFTLIIFLKFLIVQKDI